MEMTSHDSRFFAQSHCRPLKLFSFFPLAIKCYFYWLPKCHSSLSGARTVHILCIILHPFFGREKMVAALIASGASAVAVTDPNSQDPVGRTPAHIAAAYGHKGLAGYLSEVALTSHLSSLTLEESELPKVSADVEAELAVDRISKDNVNSSEGQLPLKQSLAAVRNAAQAAARIQAAFRAHSFRKRQQIEAETSAAFAGVDEYGFTANDIWSLSAASKLSFRNYHEHNKAALSIQKNYRGWKGRKEFLALRRKVVKIQVNMSATCCLFLSCS